MACYSHDGTTFRKETEYAAQEAKGKNWNL